MVLEQLGRPYQEVRAVPSPAGLTEPGTGLTEPDTGLIPGLC